MNRKYSYKQGYWKRKANNVVEPKRERERELYEKHRAYINNNI